MTSAAASITRPQRQLAASLPRLEGASNSKATNQRALKSHPPVLQNTSPRILSTVLQPNKLSPFAKQMKESSATPSERREVRFVRLLQQIQPISLTRGRLPIHYAVEHFALDDVELISQSGIDMNSKDENGNTPLMYAAGRNRVDVVRFLLRVRADATLANERGWTALHFACMNGADACILELIDAKCPLDATSVDGMTALHWAAAHGRYGCAKLLLERGAKADIATNDGKMAIHMAMRYRNDDLCVLLLENTSNWDALGTQTSNLLLQLVENALPKTCMLVLERMKQAGDVKSILQLQSPRGDTMLHLCARKSLLDVFNWVMSHGGDNSKINMDGETTLHSAVQSGDENTVLHILRLRPDAADIKDKAGKTPLDRAVLENLLDIASLIREEVGSVAAVDLKKAAKKKK